MRHPTRILVGALALSGLLCGTDTPSAEEPPPARGDVPAQPSPEALRIASAIVAKLLSNSDAQLRAMARPLMQNLQIGRSMAPERAEAMVDEVVMPIFKEHLDAFSAGLTRAYASSFGVADLKALDAFYGSPPGTRLIAAQPQLEAAQMNETNLWLKGLVPEVTARARAVTQAHGWTVQAPAPAASLPPATVPAAAPPPAP